MLAGIGPLDKGQVFSPLPHYAQSIDRLDEIALEIAALIHPKLFPGFERQFFIELPKEES